MQVTLPDQIRTEIVEANGLAFEVYKCGHGDKLALCLHGFPEHAYSWRHQMPLLAELGYEVWAPNLRGYGNTTRPKGVKAYAPENLIADTAALIDAAGKSSTTLIAHDWGGIIAWMVALRRVRPLERFIVMNLPHPAKFSENFRSWAQLKRSWYVFFFQIPWLPERLMLANGARAIGDAFYNMAIDKSRFPEDVLQVYRDNALQPGAMTAMINYYRASFRSRSMRDVFAPPGAPLDVPTLMIWGEDDVALGKELTYGTADYVTDFTLRYLPGVSHWVQQEAPEAVNAMLKAWLTGAPVPQAAYGGKLETAEPAAP